MRIVYIASEMTPFASTGGLAEVMSGLPRAVAAMGHEVFRIMPLYRCVTERGHDLVRTDRSLSIPLGIRRCGGEIWSAARPGPPTFFIRRDEFFDRSHLYTKAEGDYDDNFERFAFFQKAAVEAIDVLGLAPDIVHLNDWQTGLIPLFLEHGFQGGRRGRRERVVFTIHNILYPGRFPGSDFGLLNLPFSAFSIDTMEFYSDINCLKCGIMCADHVTTVSENYRREIMTPPHGRGLEGVFASVAGKMTGILNGIDAVAWDPATDRILARNFRAGDLAGKAQCRADLRAEMGLAADSACLVIGMVTRLTEEKGLKILDAALPTLMERNLALAILGSGPREQEELCRSWARRWPGRVGVRLAYDGELSHKIFGGSDAFLMPSREEPCGLNQFYSMRYGSLPIVRAIGGLAESVPEVDPVAGTGTGFRFGPFAPEALVEAVDRARSLFTGNPAAWQAAMDRGMRQDHSWTRAAAEYVAWYEKLCAGR